MSSAIDAQDDAVPGLAVDSSAGDPYPTNVVVLSTQLIQSLSRNWDPIPPIPHPATDSPVRQTAARHRADLSAAFPGTTIVVPAGGLQVRANDTHHRFRPESVFYWLTGETTADAVLVMRPDTHEGHHSTLYIRQVAGAGTETYFLDRTYGALTVGNAPSIEDTAATLGLPVRGLDELPTELAIATRTQRTEASLSLHEPADVGRVADELRLVKDEWEIDRLRAACASTVRGFADVARELPAVLASGGARGERWLEGTFWRRARFEGNEVGYTSIVAAGSHGTTLHWTRNDGRVEPGQLILADMGVETDQLYTADVTRTFPVTGEWSDDQLRVYLAVLEAQEAAIAEVTAGAPFTAAHRAAMWVLADYLHSWGLISVPADVAMDLDQDRPGAGAHRRYTLHRVSHMLGIDVHDCARARTETYTDADLVPGMALTVEPGLYFQHNDRTVPAELRGLSARIEDDIVVTNGAPLNLSDALPRQPSEISEWLRECAAQRAEPS